MRRLIRQPCWPHVTSSVSSAPLTLLSTTDHPPSPSLLQGSVAHTLTHYICLFGCEACTNYLPSVCVCVRLCLCILFDSFSSGHDGGCFLLQTPLRCSSIAAPQGSLTGRQRASRAPHPPSRQRLARLKGPSTRPPFIGLNGPALFIFTLRHTGGPQSHNATVALSGNSVFMCVCVCV